MAKTRFIKKKSHYIWRRILPLLLTLAVLFAFYQSVVSLSESAGAEQKRNLENALRRGIMQCYSLEGVYPPSLKYLLDHYPIYYDKDSFYVDYMTIGQNIYPIVSVIERN